MKCKIMKCKKSHDPYPLASTIRPWLVGETGVRMMIHPKSSTTGATLMQQESRTPMAHSGCLLLAWQVPSSSTLIAALALLVLLAAAPFAGRALAQKSAPHADYVVAAPVADMFAKPSAESDVTSQILYGTGVVSLANQNGFVQIHTADDYTGWVAAADLKALAGSVYPAPELRVQVAALSGNVYREPDVTKHAPLLRLPWESILESIPNAPGSSERWLAVRLVSGETGWIQHGDVATQAQQHQLSVDEMLALAHRFMGTTYTWGGVSSFGFDCSGFTQMLVRQRGVFMPRDADVQARWSGVTEVKRKNLKPGDLLFFGSKPEKITHTGMYIGQGQFIHDTVHERPGVQISNLDDAYWSHLFVAARRVKE